MRHVVIASAVLVAMAGAPATLRAQAAPDHAIAAAGAPETPPPAQTGVRALLHDIGHDFLAVPSVPNAWIAGIGGAAALAVHPVDDQVNGGLAHDGEVLRAGGVLGNAATQFAGAVATYTIGRVKHYPRAVHTGMDLLRAQVLAGTLTQGIKLAVRRERPDGKPYAFPSGHTSVTVATATVVYRHFGVWWSLPVYGMAAYVGASRLHDNRHWLSDIVFGSAVGAIGGRTVTRHGRATFTWAPVLTPGHGVAVVITRAHAG